MNPGFKMVVTILNVGEREAEIQDGREPEH